MGSDKVVEDRNRTGEINGYLYSSIRVRVWGLRGTAQRCITRCLIQQHFYRSY